ncbi:MAG: helix-turn-helix domain-containing protein [Chloroflexota bacterium]|nr:helix-turn-helix domain-containing protein [Chloroflexota bacterium]
MDDEDPNRPEILTAREAADCLRITPDTLYKLIDEGGIPAARVGRQYRIHRAHLERWLESQMQNRDCAQ